MAFTIPSGAPPPPPAPTPAPPPDPDDALALAPEATVLPVGECPPAPDDVEVVVLDWLVEASWVVSVAPPHATRALARSTHGSATELRVQPARARGARGRSRWNRFKSMPPAMH